MPPLFLGIVLTTLLSEDLACIAAGVAIAQGMLSWSEGLLACILGIFGGDLLLFAAGRTLGVTLLRWRWVQRYLPEERLGAGREWLARKGWRAVLLSRFTPGLRLPTYFAAGLLRQNPWKFSLALFVGSLLWTPLLVGASAHAGRAAGEQFLAHRNSIAGLVVGLFLLFAALRRALTARSTRLWWARWRQWEFWPAWAAYAPLVPYFLWLGIRHRGLTLFTASNPGIVSGGLTGESKSAILRWLAKLPGISPAFRVLPAGGRTEDLDWTPGFPCVAKPDVGERGQGVKILRSAGELCAYLAEANQDTILQDYVSGHEFGVFYYRYPGETKGRIFSITGKTFPVVTGDGVSTVRELIRRDKRASLMEGAYRKSCRTPLESAPAAGETVRLVEIGSHCRGTIFWDARHLRTEALESAIDAMAQAHPGFYFGRFDLRVDTVENFRTGRNLQVLELNGVGSEATHVYDPAVSIWDAYGSLFMQWRIAFEIGAANRARGAKPTGLMELIHVLRERFRVAETGRDARGIGVLCPCPDSGPTGADRS